MLKIADITKFTLQDYPNHTACVIWIENCNMRCKYCHNAEFVNVKSNSEYFSEEQILNFLQKRIGLFDGVVFSGGECTLSKDLELLIKKVKDLGFKVKIDTNGLNFDIVNNLVKNSLVDYIALDFKAPKIKFEFVTQIDNKFYDIFEKTLKYLIESNNQNLIDLEIRTTVHTDLLEEYDINNIIDILDNLNYKQIYYIQNFRNDSKEILTNLGNQSRLLDKNMIKNPKTFKVDYRNFF